MFVVMTADLSCLKNVRLVLETIGHLGYEAGKVQLVLNRSNAFTGINVKNAEGALKRTIDHQIVNEYRGAISALNSRRAVHVHEGRLAARAGRCSTSPGSSTSSPRAAAGRRRRARAPRRPRPRGRPAGPPVSSRLKRRMSRGRAPRR